jgi:RNA polymerase sigma factor for flagellar operon FliA
MHGEPATAESQTLIADHLALASTAAAVVAARVPAHVDRDELHSAALLGLTQAARTYRADRGVAFATYAKQRIHGALLDELRTADWASRSVRHTARQVAAAAAALSATLGRTPTEAELAVRTGLAEQVVRRSAADVHRAVVLNWEAMVVDGDVGELLAGCEPSPQDALLDRERLAYLRDAVTALPERLRAVVVGYFFEDRPLAELALELDVTPSRVSQLRAEALEWLRSALDANLDGDATITGHRGCRAARKIEEYTAQVGSASDFATRLTARPTPVLARLAA